MSGTIAREGFISLLYFISTISVMLGIMNILPIPLLDGGKIVILAIESVLRKDMPPKVIAVIDYAGIAFILFVTAMGTIFDIERIITG